MILWTITFELRMILQNICRRVVGNVLINISPSNILPIMLKPVNFIKIVRLVLAAVSINGLSLHSSTSVYLHQMSRNKYLRNSGKSLVFPGNLMSKVFIVPMDVLAKAALKRCGFRFLLNEYEIDLESNISQNVDLLSKRFQYIFAGPYAHSRDG